MWTWQENTEPDSTRESGSADASAGRREWSDDSGHHHLSLHTATRYAVWALLGAVVGSFWWLVMRLVGEWVR